MKMTTMKELIEKLDSLRKDGNQSLYADGFALTKPLACADGTTMSIQASSGHYCLPRVTLESFSGYSDVEIGFPTREISCIKEFAERNEDYTDTVYPYVPMDVVLNAVNGCGGIA
jgi:hypothetical protein